MQAKTVSIGSFCALAAETDSDSHPHRLECQSDSQALNAIRSNWGISIPVWESGSIFVEVRDSYGQLVSFAQYYIDINHYRVDLLRSSGSLDHTNPSYDTV